MNNLQDKYYYAGIDLHKKYSYVTIMDQMGYVQKQGRFNNNEGKLIPELLGYINAGSPIEAIVESTYGWYWLGTELENAKIPFVLAHPKKVKAVVGRKKTDKEDSKALADLRRTNLLPLAYVPTADERALRELLRFRLRLVEQQSAIKIRLRDILQKHNLSCKYQDILGKGAKKYLDALVLPFPYQDEITTLISQGEILAKDIDKYAQVVEEQGIKNTNAQLLVTIPGISWVLGLTLAMEIGDILRFKNERALGSYAGLVPSVSSSGDKTHLGQTSDQTNPYIRWALSQAITHVVKKDPSFSSFYQKLLERKKTQVARVAAMNKLARVIYFMLKNQRPFRIYESTNSTPDSNKNLDLNELEVER